MIEAGGVPKQQGLLVQECGVGLVEVRRTENEKGRYTLVFLAAPGDVERARDAKAPLVELTFNWDEHEYQGGRNFGHLAYRVDDVYETCRKLMEAASAVSAGRLYWEDGLVCRRDTEPSGQGVYVLPAFDPLLVGYEKKTNPMVPPEYLRDIYTLQGIIRPVIVAGGQCAAVWRVKRETVYVRPFREGEHLPAAEEQLRRLTGCGAVVYE